MCADISIKISDEKHEDAACCAAFQVPYHRQTTSVQGDSLPVFRSNTHLRWWHQHVTAEEALRMASWMAVICILLCSLSLFWDIPGWFCTVFRFFLLLHDQRLKLLIGTSKGSLLFCWRAHWQDSGGAMIITAPICCPWNWHQQPVAPSGQGERRDSWKF